MTWGWSIMVEQANGRLRKPWYGVDIILLGGFGLAYGDLAGVTAAIAYRAGLQRKPSLLVCTGVLLTMSVPTILCLIAVVRRVIRSWGRHIEDKYRLWSLRLAVTVGIVLYLALPFTRLGMPWTKAFTVGFRRYVKANLDLASIQAWLNSADPNACSEYVYDPTSGATLESWWPDAASWAKAITPLHPHCATLSLSSEGCPTIRIRWFGWSGSWGLAVGDPSIVTPPSSFSRQREYRLSVAPGAYVWQEIH